MCTVNVAGLNCRPFPKSIALVRQLFWYNLLSLSKVIYNFCYACSTLRKMWWYYLAVIALSSSFSSTEKGSPPDNLIPVLTVDLESALYRVSSNYLCVTIDSQAMREHWGGVNLTSPLVRTLARGLSPVTLRVGGTSQDYAYFLPDSHDVKETEQDSDLMAASLGRLKKYPKSNGSWHVRDITNFTISTSDWDSLNKFVEQAGWELVFGLNSHITKRWKAGVWDSSNAEKLVKYTMEKGYSVWAWELGNEPDMYSSPYTDIIVPKSLAKDFHSLHKMLQRVKWPNIRLAGPDTATLHRGNDFYSSFLVHAKAGVLHAVTYHQYYVAAQTAKEEDFINVNKLDGFRSESVEAAQTVQSLYPEAEVWLGETSSAFDGGANGLSNSFIAGFMWLDKLGLAALANHAKVFRQTFYGGYYSLTYEDGTPTPDYWLSLLYVRLVGPTVLKVYSGTDEGRYVRMYAHCVRPSLRYQQGGVVVYMLNLYKTETYVYLDNTDLSLSSRDEYWLEPGGDQGLMSKTVKLNGQLITMKSDITLPDLYPKEYLASAVISLPPLSFGFMVFKDAQALACMKN